MELSISRIGSIIFLFQGAHVELSISGIDQLFSFFREPKWSCRSIV